MERLRLLVFLVVGLLPALEARPQSGLTAEPARALYRVTITEGSAEKQHQVEFQVEFFYLHPEDGKRRILARILADREAFPQDLPLGCILLEGDRATVELEHPMGRMVSRYLLPLLGHSLPRARLQGTTEGQEKAKELLEELI